MFHNGNDLGFEIVLFLLARQGHLREIARNLNASPATVLRRLRTLVKEGILSHKLVGKNKVFFIKKSLLAKNFVFNAERYKFIKLLKKYPLLSVILEDVLKRTDKTTILFGSYAKFTAKDGSDIDIYIETQSKKVKESVESVNSKIRVKIGGFYISSPLIKEIIKNHVILRGVEEFYEKSKFFE